MSLMLENISTITVIARTTISVVYRTAEIVASLPKLSYQNKARSRTYNIMWISFSATFILSLILPLNLFLVLGFPWGFVSSVTPSYGPSRLWNANWSSSNLFYCSCAIFSLPPSVLIYFWVKDSLWSSTDTVKNSLCLFFFSCSFWEAKEGDFCTWRSQR